MFILSTLGRMRQENHKFKASASHIASWSPAWLHNKTVPRKIREGCRDGLVVKSV